jgi:hypothetical protein
MTKKMKCKCKHEFQDKEYGKGIRLFNRAGTDNLHKWRCTVCLNEVHGN